MSRSTRKALRGLIRALCPPPPAPQLPDLEDRIELHVRRMLMYMVPIVARGFVISVHLADWSPLWLWRGWTRIQHLSKEQGERAMTSLGESHSALLRTLLLGIRALVLSTFYDQDEVHRAMEYEPIPFLTERVAYRRSLPMYDVPAAHAGSTPTAPTAPTAQQAHE